MDHARELRGNSTDAETRLWSRLRASQLGVRFRRQHRIAGYIADFVCLEKRVIVELDGGQHADQVEYDERRTQVLTKLGFRVLRFWNNDALIRTDDVLTQIHASLAEASPPHPIPLPRRRRGRGSREKLDAATLQSPGEGQAGMLQSPLPQAPLGGEGWVRGQAPESASVSGSRAEGVRNALALRADLYTLIRRFFADRNVLEVETPILSQAGNTEPNIESFTTAFAGHRDAGSPERWLRTSPEFALKRLLADGVGDCYELGRVFRNGEAGRRHNPEFTMLEWYRVGWDHRRLADETADLAAAAMACVGIATTRASLTYRELFQQTLGLDPLAATADALAAPLADQRIDAAGLDRDDWLDLLMTHRIQPQFPHDRILIVRDYPASQCALAKIRHDDPPVAERFELYLGPYELANGYHELTDAAEQRARFVRDNARRRARGQREVAVDENLLAALDRGLPDCAGVAMGIERLLMCMAGTDRIADVIAYPFDTA